MDFPQSNIRSRFLHLFLRLTRLKPVKKQIQDKSILMMHRAHDRVVQKEEEKRKKWEASDEAVN